MPYHSRPRRFPTSTRRPFGGREKRGHQTIPREAPAFAGPTSTLAAPVVQFLAWVGVSHPTPSLPFNVIFPVLEDSSPLRPSAASDASCLDGTLLCWCRPMSRGTFGMPCSMCGARILGYRLAGGAQVGSAVTGHPAGIAVHHGAEQPEQGDLAQGLRDAVDGRRQLPHARWWSDHVLQVR